MTLGEMSMKLRYPEAGVVPAQRADKRRQHRAHPVDAGKVIRQLLVRQRAAVRRTESAAACGGRIIRRQDLDSQRRAHRRR